MRKFTKACMELQAEIELKKGACYVCDVCMCMYDASL